MDEVEFRSGALQKQQKLGNEEEAMDTAAEAATLIVGIGSDHVCSLLKIFIFKFLFQNIIFQLGKYFFDIGEIT